MLRLEAVHAFYGAGHILHGIDVYKGKPIYHGLGNFVTLSRSLSTEAMKEGDRQDWARRRRELFGFEPDPEYPLYPFHPEAKHTMIARTVVVLPTPLRPSMAVTFARGIARSRPCRIWPAP